MMSHRQQQQQQQEGQDVKEEQQPPNTTALSCHAIPFTLPSRLFGNNNNNLNKLLLLHCIDCHAAGEPARVVLAGFPRLPASAATAQDKRVYIRNHLDWIRQVLLQEPRGYPCQNVNFVFSNNEQDDDTLQYVIAEQGKIYPLMSGHNTICVATALVECGIVQASSPTTSSSSSSQPYTEFTLYAPAGPIPIRASIDQNNNNIKVTSITLTNAPSFVQYMDITVNVPHIGKVVVDIAYGGMWYCVVRVDQFAITSSSSNDSKLHVLTQLDNPQQGREFCRLGEMIKQACREQYPVQHPTLDYPGVDILVFCGTPVRTADTVVEARNVVIMSNHAHFNWKDESTWTAMIDRSPCGTGTCAVMAVLHARGLLRAGKDTLVHTSIVGSKFTGRIVDTTTLLDSNNQQRTAIVPEIAGSAYITQYSQVVVDPDDPFPHGFRVGDIW